MKNFTLCLKFAIAGFVPLFCTPVLAQENTFISKKLAKKIEADKRIDDYLELSRLGYTEKEIFEDLGNANFLAEKYEAAAFWYQKLIDLSGSDAVPESYIERYRIAMHKAGIADYEKAVSQTDWYSDIKKEYQVDENSRSKDRFASSEPIQRSSFRDPVQWERSMQALRQLAGVRKSSLQDTSQDLSAPTNNFKPPIAISSDGRVAYFSKAVLIKPEYGLFSKKEPVHKIYRAENINGQWMNVTEVGVCPKYASALHPTISPDGQRLFFSSNMPGTFGKYDIYVADIRKDGSLGVAMNLGEKVNTKKDEMFPNLVGENLLFFASDGRKGMGGLDLFAVQVGTRSVGLAVNLGEPFNSAEDDYALSLKAEEGLALVMSNRGGLDQQPRQLVFSVKEKDRDAASKERKYDFPELVPMDPNSVYTNIYYQD